VLLHEFLAKYYKEFAIAGGKLMTHFLGLSDEQTNHCIWPHLHQYISETVEDHQKFIGKALQPKLTPMQPGFLGNVLEPEDPPLVPDPEKQSIYRSTVACLQYAAT
jgi:hypothetical protein